MYVCMCIAYLPLELFMSFIVCDLLLKCIESYELFTQQPTKQENNVNKMSVRFCFQQSKEEKEMQGKGKLLRKINTKRFE